jgi:hypothetical protein
MNSIDKIKLFSSRKPNGNIEYFGYLTDIEKEKYIELLEKYTKLFINYLNKECRFYEYEDYFDKRRDIFVPINENEKDIYQLLSKPLKYFYIRNNFYIENLSEEEINTLLSSEEENNEFVKNTFNKLLVSKDNIAKNTAFGPLTSMFIAPSDSVVIGFRYDDQLLYKKNKETNMDLSESMNECIKVLEIAKVSLGYRLGVPVSVIRYDGISTNLNNEENNTPVL